MFADVQVAQFLPGKAEEYAKLDAERREQNRARRRERGWVKGVFTGISRETGKAIGVALYDSEADYVKVAETLAANPEWTQQRTQQGAKWAPAVVPGSGSHELYEVALWDIAKGTARFAVVTTGRYLLHKWGEAVGLWHEYARRPDVRNPEGRVAFLQWGDRITGKLTVITLWESDAAFAKQQEAIKAKPAWQGFVERTRPFVVPNSGVVERYEVVYQDLEGVIGRFA